MSDGGWIAIFRRIEDSGLWVLSDGQFKAAITMLLMANWDDRSMFVDGDMVSVPRGSFLSSERVIAKRANVSRKVVHGAIGNLKRMGFLSAGRDQARVHERTLFTIRNFKRIQDEAKGKGPGKGPPKGPPSLYKEVKKLREPDSQATECAVALRVGVLKWKPDHRLVSQEVPAQWAHDIERLHRLDGVSYERIHAVISWLPTDPPRDSWGGWQSVIQSGAKLRKQFDKLEAAARAKNAPAPAKPKNRRDEDF